MPEPRLSCRFCGRPKVGRQRRISGPQPVTWAPSSQAKRFVEFSLEVLYIWVISAGLTRPGRPRSKIQKERRPSHRCAIFFKALSTNLVIPIAKPSPAVTGARKKISVDISKKRYIKVRAIPNSNMFYPSVWRSSVYLFR